MDNIRYAKTSEIDQLTRIWHKCFDEPPGYCDWHFKKRFTNDNTFAYLDDNKIVSDLMMVPYEFEMRGKKFNSNFVVGAATDPDYQKKGLMKKLLKYAFYQLRGKNQGISMLYPFNYGFYRKMGYEVVSNCIRYNLTVEQIDNIKIENDNIEIGELNTNDMQSIYNEFINRFDSRINRASLECVNRIEGIKAAGESMIATKKDDQPQAYALFSLNTKDTVVVEEIAYISLKALVRLLKVLADIAQKNSKNNVSFALPICDALHELFSDDRKMAAFEPYAMMRIVDVEKTISGMKFENNAKMVIEIEDNFIVENSNNYYVEFSSNTICKQTNADADIKMDINTLARLLSGNLKGNDAVFQGVIENKSKCDLFVFSSQTSYVVDSY